MIQLDYILFFNGVETHYCCGMLSWKVSHFQIPQSAARSSMALFIAAMAMKNDWNLPILQMWPLENGTL